MHRPTILFFFSLSCLCYVQAGDESVDCSGVSLADARRVIPDDAGNAKNFLYKIWNLSKLDFCQLPFAELLDTDIFYQIQETFQRKNNEKLTLVNIIKITIIQISNEYEQKIWKTWVNSQDHGDSDSQLTCQAEVLTLEINETLHRFENMEPWNLQFFADALINELEEIIQKLGFLKTFNLNGQDMKKVFPVLGKLKKVPRG